MDIKNFTNELGAKFAKLYSSIKDMNDTKDLILEKKLVNSISSILMYIANNECLDDKDLIDLKIILSKIFEYANNKINIIYKGRENAEIFSVDEWNSYSEERKHSIMAFIAVAVTRSENLKNYEKAIENFDDKTKEWLSVNCPFEDLREVFERGLKAKTEK